MDAIVTESGQLNSQPPSHYESSVVDTNKLGSLGQVKKKALQAMDLLEGWCSKQKAAILIDFISFIKPLVVVEIGVFGGKSLIPMAFALRANGAGKIYGIDPWDNEQSIEGMDGVNRDYWNQVDHDKILNGLQGKINYFGLNSYIELIRTTSESAPIIPNIDILHIDGNHSEKTSLIDVTKWVPHVRTGGMIIFDDVNWSSTGAAVDWLDEHAIRFMDFKGDNVWGVWIKS